MPLGRIIRMEVKRYVLDIHDPMRARNQFKALLLLELCFLAGCGKEHAQKPQQIADPVLLARREKDQMLKSGSESPLREEDKARFQGLAYYDINPAYRFKVTLHRYPAPGTIRVATNTEEIRQALRYGYFDFEVDGRMCRLQVYRMLEDNETGGSHLFIPFRDGTTGKETYGGGRYIDLQENTTGIYELDFNRAYSPYCVYGRDYSCPLPPRENTLPVPIYAGEKNFPLQREEKGAKG